MIYATLEEVADPTSNLDTTVLRIVETTENSYTLTLVRMYEKSDRYQVRQQENRRISSKIFIHPLSVYFMLFQY